MIMKSVQNCLLSVRRRKRKRETLPKKDGAAWLFGIVAMIFVLILGIYCMEIMKDFTVDDSVEDTVTASGLGCLLYDNIEFSFKGNLVLNDENGNVDANFKQLCYLLKENLGLSQKNTTEFVGVSPYFNATGDNCYLKQAIFYNVRANGITVYTYNHQPNGGYYMSSPQKLTSLTTTAPDGSTIDTTSVYISFCYPQPKLKRYSPDQPDNTDIIVTHNAVVGLENQS